uniref:glycoside hydrolase family 25 protein n=1 Tax=Eubacterium cellulosolvens TaxID=29322 RepID=UPI000484A4F4|nr:glycoside hydrolase family 25 protein [[Eubacterium] cellulosolvens]
MRRRKRAALHVAMFWAGVLAVIAAGCGKKVNKGNSYSEKEQLFTSSYETGDLYNYYEPRYYVRDGEKMTYTDDENYEYRLGIDVSEHNGTEIDWKKVRDDGYEFVFIRLGYRGYSEEGALKEDPNFEANYKGARDAGLDVGVYFFSQAVNAGEAAEEAEYVLKKLEGRELQMPVTYDLESIENDTARADEVSSEQHTENIKAFSMKIIEGGYDVMLYTNLMWETFKLHMRELYDLPVWFSGYADTPQTTYDFSIWQYSNTGTVDGISGNVDLNIEMIPKKKNEGTAG